MAGIFDRDLAGKGLADHTDDTEPTTSNQSEHSRLTGSGDVFGTLGYMSPELFKGAEYASPQSDQYAIGVILYQILCNLRPYQTKNPDREERKREEKQGIIKNSTKLPQPPSSKGKFKEGDLQYICMTCLEPDPKDRYASVAGLQKDLEDWLAGIPIDRGIVVERIWRWGKRKAKRKPLHFLGTIAAIMLLIAGSSSLWYRFAYVWPSQTKFAQITNLQGVPVGITQLSDEAASRRWYHYRFTRRGWYGPIREVEILNSVERPFKWRIHNAELASQNEQEVITFGRRHEVSWNFLYTETGELLTTEAFDADERRVWTKNFTGGDTVTFDFSNTRNDSAASARLALDNPHQKRAGTDAVIVKFDFSADGLCRGAAYYDSDQEPTVDSTGVYGWTATLNEKGQILSGTNLDRDHRSPRNNRYGWAAVHFRYDFNGLEVEASYFDDSGKPVVTSEGASIRKTYDEDGRLVGMSSYGIRGEPTTTVQGWHAFTRKYDDRGFFKEEAYFLPDGKPCSSSMGYHKAIKTSDAFGNFIEERYLATDHTPVFYDGAPIHRAQYNADGIQTEVSFFGPNEEPILKSNGIHLERHVVRNGLIEEARFYGQAASQIQLSPPQVTSCSKDATINAETY